MANVFEKLPRPLILFRSTSSYHYSPRSLSANYRKAMDKHARSVMASALLRGSASCVVQEFLRVNEDESQ